MITISQSGTAFFKKGSAEKFFSLPLCLKLSRARLASILLSTALVLNSLSFPLGAQAGEEKNPSQNDTIEQKKKMAQSLLAPPMKAQLDVAPTAKSTPSDPALDKVSNPQAANDVATTTRQSIDQDKLNQERAKDFLKAGAREHRLGNDREALRLFGAALATDPHNADCYFNLGALAESQRDYVTALAHYRAGLNVRPNDAELKEAVTSMETHLSAELNADDSPIRIEAARQIPQHDVKSPPLAMQDVKMAGHPSEEVRGPEPPPFSMPGGPIQQRDYVYVPPNQASDGSFQLHSTTFDTSNSGMATVTSPGFTPPRHRGRAVAKAAGITLGVVLGVGLAVGMASARGSLHCPRCRLMHF